MVYKKFIKRDGKVYGPYLYKSVKKDGRVTTHYLGPHDSHHEHKETTNFFGSSKKPSKKFWMVAGFLTILTALLAINLVLLINLNVTGKVSVELKDNYVFGEDISGNINLILKQGELIPSDSRLIIDNVGSVSTYTLRDLISNNLNSGNFFVEGKEVTGNGEGFGVLGKKEVYPLVDFTFKVVKEKEIVVDEVLSGSSGSSEGDSGGSSETTPSEVPPDIPSEAPTQPSETTSTTQDSSSTETSPSETSSSDSSASSSSGDSGGGSSPDSGSGSPSESTSSGSSITGEVVEDNIIEGQVSKTQSYTYELKKNERIEITDSEHPVKVEYDNNGAVITTDYSEFEEGFGNDYLTNEIIKLPIDISSLNLKASSGTLKVSFVYNDVEITSSSVDIKVEDTSFNITNITNITGIPLNETNVTANLTRVERIDKIIFDKGINVEKKVVDDLKVKGKVRVIVRNRGVVVGEKLDGFNDLEVLELDEANLALLQNVEIVIDQPVSLLVHDSENIIRSLDVKNQFGLTGSGEKVCVIDTGVDPSAVNFANGFDFVNNDSDASDDNGHGTEVAYILKTIAPGSDIYVAKVIDSSGNGYESNVLEGLQWCINQNVDVISFSIGAGSYNGYCDINIVAELANSAVDSGIFVVAATGNDGSTNLKSPSCASKVTRVSSTDKQDNIAGFANVNEGVDVLAPGKDISTKSLNNIDKVVSGTSLSTPMVAGAAAIVLENESLNPLELKNRLKNTGMPILYQGSVTINLSRLDIYRAVTNNITLGFGNYSLNQTNVTNQSTYFGLNIVGPYTCADDSNYICYMANDTGVWSFTGWLTLNGSFNVLEDVKRNGAVRMNFSTQFALDVNLGFVPSSYSCGTGSYALSIGNPSYAITQWNASGSNFQSLINSYKFCANRPGTGTAFIDWAEVRFQGGYCDQNQTFCTSSLYSECYAYAQAGQQGGVWLSGATGTNTLCCGDDSGETWNGSSSGCCCNASVVANSSNNGFCSSNSQWCYYNSTTTKKDYCTAPSIYFQGNSTNNTLSCGGTCTVGEKFSNYLCDSNSDGNIEGICGTTTGSDGACIGPSVYISGSSYWNATQNPSAVRACDRNVTVGGFITEGIMSRNLTNAIFCDIDDVCFDDSAYRSDCSACSISTGDVDACDINVNDGSYSANGYCTSGGVCATGSVYNNSGTLTSGCSNGGGQSCDSVATGSESGAWTDDVNGACVVGSICDIDTVCKNTTNSFLSSCSLCAKNDVCDSDVNTSGFVQDGYCAINVSESSCCLVALGQDSCVLSGTCYANKSTSSNGVFYCQSGNWNQIDVYNNSGCTPTLSGVNRWIVNGPTSCLNSVINVASLNVTNGGSLNLNNVTLIVGNTTVNSGGSFVIRNSLNTIWHNSNLKISGIYVLDSTTLRMNGTSNGAVGINVTSTGNMTIINSSNVTNGQDVNSNYFFIVNSGALFNMKDSYLSYSGWSNSANQRGLTIYASNSLIDNSTLANNYFGIEYSGSITNETINKSFFVNNIRGIVFEYIDSSKITNNRIITNFTGGNAISFAFSTYLLSNNGSLISSNQIEIYGNDSSGIVLSAASIKNNVSFNNITTHGQNSYGIYVVDNSNNNTVMGNNITTEGLNGYGIYITDNSVFNQIGNNNIKTSGINSSGINIFSAYNNNFSYNNITTSDFSSSGISLNSNSTRNSFFYDRINSLNLSINFYGGATPVKDNVFTNIQILNLSSQIFSDANSYNNILLNSTFNESRITFGATGTNNITIKWYVRVNITNLSYSPVQGALVNVSDINTNLESSQTTDSQGLTNWAAIADKTKSLSGDTSYNNHTINVSKGSSKISISSLINQSMQINVLMDAENPLIAFVDPTFADGETTSQDYAPVNISLIESNLNNFIYNWNNTNYSFYDDSLVLMLNLNNNSALGENNTRIVDVSKYGNNGNCSGTACPTWSLANGKYNGGFNFDGAGDYFNVSNSSSLDIGGNKITISVWINPVFSPTDYHVISKEGKVASHQYGIEFNGNSNPQAFGCFINTTFYVSSNYVEALQNASFGQWQHVVCTYNGTAFIIYINGVQSAIRQTTVNIDAGGKNMQIGIQHSLAAYQSFNGKMDEIMVWNRPLSAGEVRQLYMSNLYKYDLNKWIFFANQTNLTTGDYTYFGYANDTYGGANATETRVLHVSNSPSVTLYDPFNATALINRTPTLRWNGSDPNGKNDIRAYEINITCYRIAGEGCSTYGNDNRYIIITSGNPVQEYYALTTPLKYIADNEYYYMWQVRANDSGSYSSWTQPWKFNVSAVVDISLTTNTVNFGSLSPLGLISDNTTDGSPLPLILENRGNVIVNVTLNASDLWVIVKNPSRYFQYKVDNRTESGSFNRALSKINWNNVSNSTTFDLILAGFNWSDNRDVAEIDINVTMPPYEVAGTKTSMITFSASLNE